MKKQSCIRVYADVEQINSCRQHITEMGPQLQALSRVLSLAGNQVRLSILYLLHQQGKLCVCDLSDILEMKIPAISQHLRKLKDGGLVEANKVAQTVFYSLRPTYVHLLQPHFTLLEQAVIEDTKG
ncbi:MAG: transcriptional regulator [Bacteroidetes bacterium]|nr:MAG: transcriptional regulator [Bacteroidota bacterium]